LSTRKIVMNCIDPGRNTSGFYQCLGKRGQFFGIQNSRENAAAPVRRRTDSNRRKALQAFPFPLGYGATSQSIKSAQGA
jgi:hypothetical protein